MAFPLKELREAAEKWDAAAFVALLKQADWAGRTEEDYVELIRLAFGLDYRTALGLARKGVEAFPHSEELRKLFRMLEPPEVRLSDRPPDPMIGANLDCLEENAQRHPGKWLGVRKGELLGVADTLDDLEKQLGSLEGVLVDKGRLDASHASRRYSLRPRKHPLHQKRYPRFHSSPDLDRGRG